MSMPHPDDEAIFHAARRIAEPDARRDYLRQACGGDGDLLARIEALLRVHDRESGLLNKPPHALERTVDNPAANGPGTQIGPYKLLEQIGEGGFGTVFMAQQQHPLRRMVAVKLLKRGMDSGQVVARFDAERQALALMNHPNIAQVLDGGETASGRPYFVMELVKGVPITKYCDDHRLTPRERLALFVPVCDAVQHAHQKGIVHRDIKPNNVLVAAYDGKPVPKVIDFGVAKALGQQLTERTLVTSFGGIVGTLEYMSPEQAEFNALDIDTRADVYALGVLLYELLTGTTPLTKQRLKEAAFSEVLRLIREEEPPTPSTRLSEAKQSLASVSAQRKLEPAKLTKEIRGEVDWIVMKCLEKDRGRRYETPSALARDIQRYLADEAVEASPPSTAYRLKKFARRHKAPIVAMSLLFLSLLGGIVGTTWGLLRTERARADATENAERADREALAAIDNADRANREAESARKARFVSDQGRYVSDIRLAQQAWEDNRLDRLVELLDGQRPVRTGGTDHRGLEWHYWKARTKQSVLVLDAHANRTTDIAFSPDGRRIATASWDETARLWDASTGRELLTLEGHAGPVDCLAFAPDGNRLVTAAGNTAFVWDAASGRRLSSLKGPTGSAIQCVAFTPDGGRVVTGAMYDTVRVWDAASGNKLLAFQELKTSVFDLAISPDGSRLATASGDKTIRLWEMLTGRELLQLKGHASGVAFSPDGSRLATGYGDNTARIWDLGSGQEILTLSGHTGAVSSVAFSPDGRRLATASHDNTARVWDATTGRDLVTLKGHTNIVMRVAFSPDGRRLATASGDFTARVWDLPNIQDVFTLRGHAEFVKAVTYSSDGRRLATAYQDGMARVWDATTGQQLLEHGAHKMPLTGLAFSPSGRQIATASWDKTVRVWNASNGHEDLVLGHTAFVNAVAFSPDGRRIATGSMDAFVRVWEAASGQELVKLKGHKRTVKGVAFSPDSRRLASASGDFTARVWDADTGQEILVLKGHTNDVDQVAFSPNGRHLATASFDNTARVWDLASGQELLMFKGHTHGVHGVAFSPDGRRLATASTDNTTRLWDAENGEELLVLKRPQGSMPFASQVVFSPDGRSLATNYRQDMVRIWETENPSPDTVRQRHLNWLVGHEWSKYLLSTEVESRLRDDRFLNEDERADAIKIAKGYPEFAPAESLNNLCWPTVAKPGRIAGDYELALRQAEAACRQENENAAYLNTLGVAQYRCGLYKEALETLTRSDKLHSNRKDSVLEDLAFLALRKRSVPEDLAFLAMTHHQLGNTDQAKAFLEKLREAMKTGKPSDDAKAFLKEAEELIEGKKPAAAPVSD